MSTFFDGHRVEFFWIVWSIIGILLSAIMLNAVRVKLTSQKVAEDDVRCCKILKVIIK